MGNIENCFKQAKTLLNMKLLCEVVGNCILLKKNWQYDALINHAQSHPYHLQVVKALNILTQKYGAHSLLYVAKIFFKLNCLKIQNGH